MKKLFSIFAIATMILCLGIGSGLAANQNGHGTSGPQGTGHNGPGNNGNDKPVGNVGPTQGSYTPECGGSNCGPAIGYLDVDAFAFGAGIDCGLEVIPNGIAGGISGGAGVGSANANGFVIEGDVEAEVSAIGGGLTVTDAYTFHPEIGDLSIGVGSSSFSQGITGADIKVKVDPEDGFGVVSGDIFGLTAEGTLNGSLLGPSPMKCWDSEGVTLGIAGQGALGGFYGDVFAASGPDYGWCCWKKDSKAGAGAGAMIDVSGYSYSESYRYIDFQNDGIKTEGMGTNVGAGTTIASNGYNYDWDKGLGCADSNLYGGWTAVGGAGTITVQDAPGLGLAKAGALGMYKASGSLNCNLDASVAGYSNTSVTTVQGYNGSVNTAGSGMNVSVHTDYNSGN